MNFDDFLEFVLPNEYVYEDIYEINPNNLTIKV